MLLPARKAIVLVMLSTGSPLPGCASFHRTRPFDMSASEHEEAAAEATARATQEALEAQKGGRAAGYHQALARRDADLAAAHAGAARALISAQDRACDGVPARDIAPGVSGLRVLRVSMLERPFEAHDVIEGAGMVVAIEGRTFDSFAQLIHCRAARAAVTRDPSDPLAVAGASLRVYRDDGDAAVVQFRSMEPERAREIFRRVTRQMGGAVDPEDARSSDMEDVLGVGRSRDGGHDPRGHGSGPAGPEVPGGLVPIGGSTGRGGRP